MRQYFGAHHTLLGIDRPFEFESAAGTTKMESLGKDGRVINRLAPGRTILVVVDNDTAGRGLYKNQRLGLGGRWVQHRSNGVHWCRLPFSYEFSCFMKSTGISDAHWPGSLENLFTPALRAEAERDGVLRLTATPHDELLNSERYPWIQTYLPPADKPERYYVLTIEHNSKTRFAEWVTERARADSTILETLRPVVEGIYEILLGHLP